MPSMTELKKGLFGLIAMLALSTSLPVSAQTIESLVMPGEVVLGHADIENGVLILSPRI